MALKAVHDTQEEIPEQYRDLYTEKGGKWELTGVDGIKTSGDVARIQASLDKERNDHKATKDKLSKWGDLEHDDVVKKLDRIAELEAAAEGKLDDAKIDELATKRADGILKTKVAPLEREIAQLKKANGELTESNTSLTAAAHTRSREDMLRPLLVEAKVLPEHHEDVFLYAERHLGRNEDGSWSVKDGANLGSSPLTVGATPKDWLGEMLDRRPGWLPGSQGGGSRGSGPAGGGFRGSSNPWSHENWNMTKQGEYLREHGPDKAAEAAKQAGTKLGGMRPAPKK